MHNRLIFLVMILAVVLFVSSNFSAHLVETEQIEPNENPIVVWYVIAKWLEPDFLDMVEKYQPDIVLLTIFAEDVSSSGAICIHIMILKERSIGKRFCLRISNQMYG